MCDLVPQCCRDSGARRDRQCAYVGDQGWEGCFTEGGCVGYLLWDTGRQLLTRSLAPAAERGCDCCGILARKGSWNATKYLGCDALINMLCVLYSTQRRIQGSVVRHKMLQ
jgi:hypothetical protein